MLHWKIPAILLMCTFMGVFINGCGPDKEDLKKTSPKQIQKSTNRIKAFKLPELGSGKLIDFPAAYKNKKTALVFFSTGWPACVNEVLQLQPIIEKQSSSGFKLIIVTTDSEDDLISFLKDNPISATFLLDDDGKVFEQYQVEYIPNDYLADESGNVIDSFVGWDDKHLEDFKKWLDS